ncbi:hypothetical protein D9619_005237 [Psilocybe cf. subviscida]|uniref:DUF4139 domain-containing protein n=1 Tax=Psilocybe cf. subviscida TaxID=2480587 RepID=A0A8H5BVX3_9AGAR|nr:hypothetical protein D9619_005237 [Psilocybe cf. subviscida]
MSTSAPADSQVISLVAADDGQIANINLYSGHAELTRTFNALVNQGENRIDIHALPVSLVDDSLRIEGHGWATIRDVVVDKDDTDRISRLTTEAEATITALKHHWRELDLEISTEKQARASLEKYLGTVKTDHIDLAALRGILEEHRRLSKEIDVRTLDLEKQRAEVDKKIKKEKEKLTLNNAKQLSRKVSINVLAEREGELTFSIKYLVQGANWTPTYELQANTQKKEKPLAMTYKALITQSTYEAYAKISLETAAPSLSMTPPSIHPWRLWVRNFDNATTAPQYPGMLAGMSMPFIPPSGAFPVIPGYVPSRSDSTGSLRRRSRTPPPPMRHLQVTASDKKGVMATFQVPGRVSLPSDMRQHNITIAQLDLDAEFSWYCMPQHDERVYIKAKIKNTSEYRFIPGQTKTYVDGSFASTGSIASVSPQETFEFSLGVDPAIKVTYHPFERKVAQSGLYSKTVNQTLTQRISIHNTRSTPITNFKVTDSTPVSEDQRIEVRLVSPALTVPTATVGTEKSGSSILKLKAKLSANDSVKVAPNVRAQWNGLGEPDVDQKALGKDGMVTWFVSLAAQERVTLVLQYEVSYAEGLAVEGV